MAHALEFVHLIRKLLMENVCHVMDHVLKFVILMVTLEKESYMMEILIHSWIALLLKDR